MVKYSQQLDRTFAALADDKRRSILERLAGSPCSVSELAEDHNITLAGILKHVRVLQEAGLIETAKYGRNRVCAIKPDSCDSALHWLESHRDRWQRRFDSLERYLAERQ